MKFHQKTFCIIGLGLLLSTTSLLAAQKSAKEIVASAYAYLGSMDKYAFDAIVVDNDMIDGKMEKFRHDVSVKIDRPGNLRVDVRDAVKNRTNYIHNGLYTIMDHNFKYYGQLKVAKTIDKTLDLLFDSYGIKAPLATLMYSDMNKRIKFRQSKYFGTMDVAGVECDYVAFRINNKEIHVWITTGVKPLVKAYSIIDGESRINTSLTWQLNPKLSESDFVFSAPKDASKISINSAN